MPRLTQKGQVAIPLPIRKRLNLKTGDGVQFVIKEGDVAIQKRKAGREGFKKYVGFLDHLSGKRPDKIIEELRGKAYDFSS